MRHLRIWIAFGLFAAFAGNAAVIYKWTDGAMSQVAKQCVPGAEKIEVGAAPRVGTFGEKPPPPPGRTAEKPNPTKPADYTQFVLSAPAPEQVFFNDEPVNAHLNLDPGLLPNHVITWYVNGSALGDQASINLLENTCVDAKTAPGLRVHAAEDLLNVSKNRKCLPAVLSIAQNATEDTARAEALTLLPNYFLKGGEAPTGEVLTAICGGLTDGSLFVRMQSTASLERIGTSRQATCLETALSQEQDETSRNAMKRVLKSLKSRAAP